ncbi:MAG: GNAT family N-acetyltransferase, partial [Chitinophagaceae bacterium]|nr:GNAT family N-acetyltransferase [Chitinophagaceae bacterium]
MKYTDGLESERLTTRFLTEDDIPVFLEYFEDPVNCRFMSIPDHLSNLKRSEIFINFQMKRYSENRLGLQAIITKDTGAFAGTCGLLVQEVDGVTEIEVGYHYLRRFWGKGYATEAAQLFRDYGFEHYDVPHLVSMINPANEPSKKVAHRNGMSLVKED